MKSIIYVLVWHSRYGKEEVDEFDTLDEAQKMRHEYLMAYGEGSIDIIKRRQ